MTTTSKVTSSTKPFRFGIVGEFQSGKSLLINCLLRRSIATVGYGVATTHTVVNYRYSENEHLEYLTDDGVAETKSIDKIHDLDTRTDISVIDVYLTNELLKNFILTDMPGFGANENDTWASKKSLPFIDFVILIQSNDTAMGANSTSFRDFGEIKRLNIPYYLILNCTNSDRWKCDDYDNNTIAKTNLDLLDFKPINYPLEEDGINIVNLMWYWFSICDNKDELINRPAYKNSFKEYEITPDVKEEVGKASNFKLINKIFDMENRAFLELRRDIKNEITKLREELCPIGTIQAFAFNGIPYGWLPCDGSRVSIIEYHELYDVIGNTFGEIEENTFCIPNLQDQFIRGWCGDEKVRTFGSSQEDAFQGHGHIVDTINGETEFDGSHTHKVYREEHGGGMGTCFYSLNHEDNCVSDSCKKGAAYILSGGGHRHKIELKINVNDPRKDVDGTFGEVRFDKETRPKNVALLYCIKAY